MSELLDISEKTVVEILAEAWNQFCNFEELHPMHKDEFCRHIHEAQRIVMSRPVVREIGYDNTRIADTPYMPNWVFNTRAKDES